MAGGVSASPPVGRGITESALPIARIPVLPNPFLCKTLVIHDIGLCATHTFFIRKRIFTQADGVLECRERTPDSKQRARSAITLKGAFAIRYRSIGFVPMQQVPATVFSAQRQK